ncbi:MAG: hypothetical protein AYK22_00370 [Thermoplasmatales archaeon SG8-52-3]|nr:MAG: hypothetical protein AYK22_00370 [Thermoplasmatales archaeon SG8-52-3]
MKKIFPIVIITMLVIIGMQAGALTNSNEVMFIKDYKEGTTERATHTVLGEYGTATWCGYCRYAHGALKELYSEGQLDFYYITHVSDMNSRSSSYLASHYNLYGYPTVWWDGGYKINIGAGSVPSAKSAYTSSINSCLNRAVDDVNLNLAMTWLDGTKMKIDCTVINNEGSTYGGTIQVAICEKVSSRGWIDTGGVTYTMTFLDWAFKESLSISSGGSWSDTITWDGSSHGYPTVTKENTIIIGAVYNDEWHQGYSYTPPQNPFDAYYVDDCVAVEAGGSSSEPPNPPAIDGPTNGVMDIEYDFIFNSEDPDGDDVSFYILWGDGYVDSTSYSPTGTDVIVSHIYTKEKTFTIQAKAIDSNGVESNWSEFEITIPRTRQNYNYLFNLLLEKFPNLYLILKQLIKI